MNARDDSTLPAVRSYPPFVHRTIWALVLIAGIWHAASLATVNDDAFISFRYAKQLVDGNGLVYNPGERVEGNTNFLWTVMIAGGMAFGADPVMLSIILGIACFAGTLTLLMAFSRRLSSNGRTLPGVVPLAAVALVLHRDANVYATSGLETSLVTLLVTAILVLLASREDATAFLVAGVLLTVALLTRPDSIVYGAAVAAFIVLERRQVLRRLVMFAIPLIALFLPYWLIRWSWFGYFFPNAFYAKSIDLPYYTQGMTYAEMYFTTYYALAAVVLVSAAALVLKRSTPGAPAPSDAPAGRALRLGILFVGFFTLFIIRSGGDFMFARFFIPTAPALCMLAEILVRRIRPPAFALALAAALLVGTVFRYDHFTTTSQVGHIADEWRRYPLSSLDQTKKTGATLRKFFDGLPVRVAFWGAQARLMYYAEPYQAIETITGLTDTAIAHSPIAERGRPGHEKPAPEAYLVRRGVDFTFRPPERPTRGLPLNFIAFDSIVARIVCYRNEVMEGLRNRPGARFQPMPEYLDAYIAGLDKRTPLAVATEFAFFQGYYFQHNDDAAREATFMTYLSERGLRVARREAPPAD